LCIKFHLVINNHISITIHFGQKTTPRLYISNKSSLNHDLLNNNSNKPYEFSRLCITGIIQSSENMHINNNKKQTSSICMQITQLPSVRNITHQMLYTMKCKINMCCIMHCQKNSSLNLQNQTLSCLYSPIIITIQIRWCRIRNLMILYNCLHGLIPLTPSQFLNRSSHLIKYKFLEIYK